MTTSNGVVKIAGCVAICLTLTACDSRKFNPADGAPQPGQATETGDMSLVAVYKPDLFPLVAAEQVQGPSELNVTGTVNPDVSREVPVISLASGRVIDIKTRLGNEVKKGQLPAPSMPISRPSMTSSWRIKLMFARKTYTNMEPCL
jgi:cobalt-zinc-cadmium efflux system membrane fusion protein